MVTGIAALKSVKMHRFTISEICPIMILFPHDRYSSYAQYLSYVNKLFLKKKKKSESVVF